MMKIFLSIGLALFATAILAPSLTAATPALEDPAWQHRNLAPGVDHFQGNFDDLFGRAQVVNVLRVNLDEPGVRVRFAVSHPTLPRKRRVPEFVEETGAIAAINGGYSGGGRGGPQSTNSGIFKIDGEVRPFQQEETEEFHFVGGAALGIDAGENWHFRNRPANRWPVDWPKVEHALAGAQRLIENGELHPSISRKETAREERHVTSHHPRTAVGLLPDRTALLITVDGRHAGQAEGMSLEELAALMKDLGCVEAINYDGGGSTTMWIRNSGVINHPSDNRQFDHEGARRVFSAIIVLTEDAS